MYEYVQASSSLIIWKDGDCELNFVLTLLSLLFLRLEEVKSLTLTVTLP